MNRYNLSLIVLFFLMAGCRQQDNVKQLMDINKSLEYSNAVIHDDTHLIYAAFQDKLRSPQTEAKAPIWFAKATEIQKHVTSISMFIEGLKNELIKQSDSLKNMDQGLVKQLFITNGKAHELFIKMAGFKDSIPAIFDIDQPDDSDYLKIQLTREIERLTAHSLLLAGYSDRVSETARREYAKNWVTNNFSGSSSIMALLALNKIEIDLLTTEKIFTEYCYNQIATHGFNCNFPSPIAILSSSYVKQGQHIEVTAGIGYLSAAAKPAIVIDGKIVKLNESAAAVYSFNANGKPGKHVVPVKITLIQPDGSTAIYKRDLEYIIAEER